MWFNYSICHHINISNINKTSIFWTLSFSWIAITSTTHWKNWLTINPKHFPFSGEYYNWVICWRVFTTSHSKVYLREQWHLSHKTGNFIKARHMPMLWPSNSTPKYKPQRNDYTCPQKDTHDNVHVSFPHNNWNLEIILMFPRRMAEQTVVYSHDGAFHNKRTEANSQ